MLIHKPLKMSVGVGRKSINIKLGEIGTEFENSFACLSGPRWVRIMTKIETDNLLGLLTTAAPTNDKTCGFFMGFYGFLWVFMGFYGFLKRVSNDFAAMIAES